MGFNNPIESPTTQTEYLIVNEITKSDIIGNSYYKIEFRNGEFEVHVRTLTAIGLGFIASGATIDEAASRSAKRINDIRANTAAAERRDNAAYESIPEANR